MLHWSELKVFKKAHSLTLEIYKLTENFPRNEIFGITSQFRRAAYSIPVNIVEGKSRKNTKELVQFLNIANASLEEVRCFLLLPKNLHYIDNEKYSKLELESECETISKMLNSFIKTLRKKVKNEQK